MNHSYGNIAATGTYKAAAFNPAEKTSGGQGAYLADNRHSSVAQTKQVEALANGARVQRKANDTGLPDQLKSGVESLSGHSMDDVKVHYNSDKPAQLNAYAYAQGADIHIAAGQEKHLPHEAWHVVQQKQGRVRPILQMKGKVNINDDKGLEKEADVMGAKALQRKAMQGTGINGRNTNSNIIQRSVLIGNAYQNLEPPTQTLVKTLMRWSGLPRATVINDLNRVAWGMNPMAQFNAVTQNSLPRPTSVHAILDGNGAGVRNQNLQTGIGHLGDLEDLLKGRGPSNYHGGHLLGDQYGGFWGDVNTAKNMTPQSDTSNTNGGAWYRQEHEIAFNLNLGKHLLFEAWVVYPAQTYSVPYNRIKNLLIPGSPTALALQNKWVYGIQSAEGAQDTATAGARLGALAAHAGQSLRSLAQWNIGASLQHGLTSAYSGLSAIWPGAKAAADAAIGLKNQAYVTFNTWAPSQYNLKYVTLRGIRAAPRGATHRRTLPAGNIGGVAELMPSLGALLEMLRWYKVPLGSIPAVLANNGPAALAFSRLGGDAAMQRFNPLFQGYTSASPLGGTVLDNQDHAINNQFFEVLNTLRDVGVIYLAVKYLSVAGYNASGLAAHIMPYIMPWLPGWISVGITPGLIASSPAIATALLIWLAYHKMPGIRHHLPVVIQEILDKLGV